jgi:hypothetical protein
VLVSYFYLIMLYRRYKSPSVTIKAVQNNKLTELFINHIVPCVLCTKKTDLYVLIQNFVHIVNVEHKVR